MSIGILRTLSDEQIAALRDPVTEAAVDAATSALPYGVPWQCYLRSLLGLGLVSRAGMSAEGEEMLTAVERTHIVSAHGALGEAGLSAAQAEQAMRLLGGFLAEHPGLRGISTSEVQEAREQAFRSFVNSLPKDLRSLLAGSGPQVGSVVGLLGGAILAALAAWHLWGNLQWPAWGAVLAGLAAGVVFGALLAGGVDTLVSTKPSSQ